MPSFKANESYMHLTAKEVVAGWLREVQDLGECDIDPVSCRTNRRGVNRGVYTEYSIGINHEGADCVWDETIAGPSGTQDFDFCPTPKYLLAKNYRLACVCDIAVLHKGTIGCAIEIIHRHQTPRWKLDFLERLHIPVHEVCAYPSAALHITAGAVAGI